MVVYSDNLHNKAREMMAELFEYMKSRMSKLGSEVSELESYIKDAWFNYCNSGDPIKPNFIKEKKHATKPIYFGIDSIDYIYK